MHPREGRTRPNVMGACLVERRVVRPYSCMAGASCDREVPSPILGSTKAQHGVLPPFAPYLPQGICPTLPASQHPCCLLQLRLTTASASACFPLCRRSTHPRTFYVALVTGRRRTVSNEAPRGLLGRTPQQDTLCLTNEPPSAKGKRGGSSRPMVAPASLGTVR